MVVENPTWGAPRIHGELQRSVAKTSEFPHPQYIHVRRARVPPGRDSWRSGMKG
jgi:hypothetical protein